MFFSCWVLDAVPVDPINLRGKHHSRRNLDLDIANTMPASVLLMSVEGRSGRVDFIIVFVISALAKVVIYGLVGSLVSFLYRRFFFRSA